MLPQTSIFTSLSKNPRKYFLYIFIFIKRNYFLFCRPAKRRLLRNVTKIKVPSLYIFLCIFRKHKQRKQAIMGQTELLIEFLRHFLDKKLKRKYWVKKYLQSMCTKYVQSRKSQYIRNEILVFFETSKLLLRKNVPWWK